MSSPVSITEGGGIGNGNLRKAPGFCTFLPRRGFVAVTLWGGCPRVRKS